MQIFSSKDGTSLACWQSGHGEPLLLLHGTSGDHLTFSPIIEKLSQHFSVWSLDRRGRGQSGDAEHYSLMSECDDVAAVVEAIGGQVHIFAHSFGGLCALKAARLTKNIGKLMIYEAPLSLKGSSWSDSLNQHMQSLLDAGHREELLVMFLTEIVGASNKEIGIIKNADTWDERVAAAHTILRELQVVDSYVFEAEKFQAVIVPTLLFLGAESPERRRVIANTLEQSLPNSSIVELLGQQHGAVRTAPDLLVDK
ncbi:MAG: alpha/beta fold hydrolase, partial [Methylococcaceae bacterium]|nr:alpha/beta fold hydrolase [Methylococcaceae bacterium]